MAFRFSLASVLRLRESIEKMEEQSLQKIDMEIARVLHVIDELDEKTVKLRSARDRELEHPVAAIEILSFQWRCEETLLDKDRFLHDLKSLKQQRSRQVDIYRSAHRNHEILKDLSDKAREVYDLELARLQQKILDDMVLARRRRI